jgi:hypothetical protein
MVTLASDSTLLVQSLLESSPIPVGTRRMQDSWLSESRTTRMVNRNSSRLGLVGAFAIRPMFRGWTSTNHKAHTCQRYVRRSWKKGQPPL